MLEHLIKNRPADVCCNAHMDESYSDWLAAFNSGVKQEEVELEESAVELDNMKITPMEPG